MAVLKLPVEGGAERMVSEHGWGWCSCMPPGQQMGALPWRSLGTGIPSPAGSCFLVL